MNSQQKEINLLTICKKSGRIILGFDAVKEAAFEGDISAVLITSDISMKTLKEVKFFCNNTQTEITRLDLKKEDIFEALGKEAAVMGIADRGFANRLRELGEPVKATIPRSAKKENSK